MIIKDILERAGYTVKNIQCDGCMQNGMYINVIPAGYYMSMINGVGTKKEYTQVCIVNSLNIHQDMISITDILASNYSEITLNKDAEIEFTKCGDNLAGLMKVTK